MKGTKPPIVNQQCVVLVSRPVSRYIVHVLHRSQLGQDVTSDDTWRGMAVLA